MIDIDKLKIRAEMSISRENSFFAEYSATAESLDVQALFSLKHRQILLSKPSKAFDFVNDLQNRVLRAIARKHGARLFMVVHGDAELPPFDIHEVCPRTGEITRKAYIPENSKDAWVDAWRELNLL